jgi:hypothetical protein
MSDEEIIANITLLALEGLASALISLISIVIFAVSALVVVRKEANKNTKYL